MPPRRSTRARASVEPPPAQEKTSNSKRKRADENDEPTEPSSKPVSRARKPSVPAKSTGSRVSARARKSLEEVHESEEEEEEQETPPPVKKSRASAGVNEEEVRPQTKGRRGAASRGVRNSVKKEEEEEEKPEKPSTRSRRSTASTSKPAPRGRSIRASKSKRVQDSDDEEEEPLVAQVSSESEEEIKPARRGRGGRPARGGRSSGGSRASGRKVVKVEDDEEEEPPLTVADTPASGQVVEDEAVVPELDQPQTDTEEEASEVAAAILDDEDKESTPAPVVTRQEPEEEEEHSLLDIPDPPTARPQILPTVVEEPQGPKPRLVIHKMALVDFKSYAGRQEIGPFHKSFSAIVGPNGSGKSNTIDALLFVFGYRASKMRQGKLSELIHNSARYPDLEECSVEVHFREIIDLPGPDSFEVVPKSQLVVTRTAYKNNSSKYTINGRVSNYKEVQTLLKGRGIDLDHNRFLILQGEVESISQMKPKAPSEHEDGLLEYLEDIIGTSSYKEPIDEALQAMDALNEDRGEKLGRLKIVERERNALEEQKKEAEDYLRLQNEHVRALSRLWQWYIWKCLQNEEEFNKAIDRIEREIKDETEHNKDDITHLTMLEKHYAERCTVYEEVKTAAAEALKDLALHEKQQVSLEERRKHAKTKAKKLSKSLQEDEKAKAEAERAVVDNTSKIKKEKKKLEGLEDELGKEEGVLEDIRDSLKDKTQVYHDQIEVKQKELQPWTTKINATQAEIDVATSERDTLAKKAEAVKEASEQAVKAVGELKEHHESKMAELEELKETKASKAQEMKAGQKKLHDIKARVEQLRTKASSTRQRAEEAKSSQQSASSQNKVLDTLTRLQKSGRINGFHGRLGSLGTIPDKYDVAISTACGALNNLVVDTVEQGQQCIEYLRKQNVGRASFLVLEKLSSQGLDKIQTPENVPRLFDLIKPKDPRFAPAFFKAVHNTLVADDLEQANRIAFGARRWRVVTLAGQLIDASGTMSGGGNTVARGGMSSKLPQEAVSSEELRQMEKESEVASRALDEMQRELREVEGELDALSRAGPQVEMAIEKVGLDIQTGTKRIAEAEKRVRDLKAQSKPDTGDVARIRALEKDIQAKTAKLEELQEKTASIEAAIKALEKKILEVGGARLLTQKSKVDGIRLHINLANDEITKAEVAKAKGEKDVAKLEQAVETNSSALEEMQEELESLNEQLEETNGVVEDIRSKVEAAQQAAENSKDDLDNLKTELDEKTEQIQAFRQKEMELQQSLNDTKKEAGENDRALTHWQAEHDKLKLEDVDDEDEEDAANVNEAGPSGEAVDGVKAEPTEIGLRQSRSSSYELHIYTEEELAIFKKRELVADAELLDEKVKNAKPNLSVLKDYRKREEEFLRRAHDLDQVTQQRDAMKQKYETLRKQRLDEFMAGFNTISLKLKEMYQMITLGGNAELELVDSMDPFSEGIIFSVMPPKKSWRNISNLSGGEKTLSSLALVFALHVYKPTPLYFMDEIDAALDFRNVSIVANYIKDRTKNAQFIIISLRNDMFELSHRLIGIYKTSNATRSISIDNHSLHTAPQTSRAAPSL